MSDDLFGALDKLFTKQPAATPPGMFIVNRFLSWHQGYARYAPYVSRLGDQREDDGEGGRRCMAWEVWRTMLPKRRGAPRLGYPAPKRLPDVEGLAEALMLRTHLSRTQAETAAELAKLAGRLDEMNAAYGVDVKEGTDE